MISVNATHDPAVLVLLGAQRVTEVYDKPDTDPERQVTGYEIEPDIDLSGYEAAAASYQPSVPALRLSFLQFMDLFTDEEQLALAGAAMTDAATKLWYDRAVGAQFIALDDARLAAGLQAFVDAGLISGARRDLVLAGQGPQA